jgi:hypothetical protein
MQVQSTVAVSRLVGAHMKGEQEHLDFLKDSLKAIKEFSHRVANGPQSPAPSPRPPLQGMNTSASEIIPSSANTSNGPKPVGDNERNNLKQMNANIAELINRMFRLIEYSSKVLGSKQNDPETIAELYYKISNDYFDSPDLRVQWLENLAEFHITQNNLEEAAQVKLHIASLVVEYLSRKNELKARGLTRETSFEALAPNILEEAGVANAFDESAFQNLDVWDTKGLTKLLTSAFKLLKKAKAYELCLEVQTLLSNIYKAEKDYPSLVACLKRFENITQALIEANKDVRIFPTYYRVGFYGPRFEELANKEFIYRVPGHVKLGHIQTQLKEKHANRVDGDTERVVIMQNKEMQPDEIDPSRVYIQLGAVQPHSDSSCVTPHERNFNINAFIFESGYSAEGKNVAKEGLAQQQKRKRIFRVDGHFPFILNRLQVTSTENVILTPLENAIELIEGRVAALREQMQANPTRLNALQSVIQGSVVTMVNEGPIKICETFLVPDAVDSEGKRYPPDQIAALKEKMVLFVRMCGFAISLNNRIISSEHLPFQKMVEEKYAVLNETVKRYLDTEQ